MTIKIQKLAAPILVFLILSSNICCQKSEIKTSPITGTWIELEKKSDTIIFSPDYDGLNPVFELKRGFRISEGFKLPDYFSGPYSYQLGDNSISVFWFFSSSSFQTYYFNMTPEKNKFLIGNFFKDPEMKNQEADTLIFIRIN